MTPTILANNNFSVLPFYTDIELQNHRKSYAYGDIYPLFTPANFILPFQIMRPSRNSTSIGWVRIFDVKGKQVADITARMKETGLQIARFPDYGIDVIVYPGTLPYSNNVRDGVYYLSLYDGANVYYSEMFTAKNNISDLMKIEWWDLENMIFDSGIIVYNNPLFKNKLFLCAEIGKPEYTFEEDGENRDGYYFYSKQLSEKTYKFTILAPEYLCDAIRLIRMSDYIQITDRYNQVYNCDTFLITPEWQGNGNLASVDVEFETATVVKKTGKGYTLQNKGDYNNDYNNDYNID